MTSPIKPPSGPPVMPLEGLERGATAPRDGSVGGAESASDFKASLGAHGAPTMAPVASAIASGALGSVDAADGRALGAALRSQAISPAQALDALVAQALDSADARRLEPAARAELEQHLRTMLAEDPSLRELAGDLSRT